MNRNTGLRVPVEVAAVADAPYDYSDRLVPLSLGLERLHRFREATPAHGQPAVLRGNFLVMVARLFGDEAADEVEEAIADWQEPQKGA